MLVIAADIRPIDQVLYTPAPDIIHEAAGHAPIIADQEYSAYLRDFGKAGSRAFSSVYDAQVYEAIRHLSILKLSLIHISITLRGPKAMAATRFPCPSRLNSSPCSEMALLLQINTCLLYTSRCV